MKQEIEKGIVNAVKEIQNNTETADLLQRIQYDLKCCGWSGPKDYEDTSLGTTFLPASCCGLDSFLKPEPNPKATCPKDQIKYDHGCKDKLNLDQIDSLFTGTLGVGVVVILFQLVLIFAACCIARDYWESLRGVFVCVFVIDLPYLSSFH